MATYKSDKVTNERYDPSASPHSAREIYGVCTKTSLLVTDVMTLDDVVQLAVLPANCVPVDCKIFVGALDSGATLTVTVGILDADGTGIVPNSLVVAADSDVGQAGGTLEADNVDLIFDHATWLDEASCPEITAEKILAILVTASATGGVAGTILTKLKYCAIEQADKPTV